MMLARVPPRELDNPYQNLYHSLVRYSQPYHNAVAIQKLITADAKSEKVKPRERCLLARAFVELETLKLRLRMKPAPKPVDVSHLHGVKRATKQASEFTES